MELHTIGIDGKTVFHLVGLKQRGEVVVQRKFLRKQQLPFTTNLTERRAILRSKGVAGPPHCPHPQ
jgi:hypothetical protein